GHIHHGAAALDGDAAVQGADDAVGDGAAQLTQGVAHGDDLFAYHEVVAVAHSGGGQAGGVDLDHRDVAGGVGADDGGGIVCVADGDGDVGGVLNHVS